MDRKKTILIAVMINAGLLAVLFVASLTTHEEISTSSPYEMAENSFERPLFPDSADLALQQQTASNRSVALPPMEIPLSEPQTPNEIAPAPVNVPVEEPVAHKLPPLVPESVPAAPVAAAPAPAPVKEATPGFIEVVVKKGDSLDKIARAHNTTVDEIIKINHLPSSFLRVGQVLKLPANKGTLQAAKPKPIQEKTALPGNPEYYTVKVGDNPWTIAMKHHLKVEELLKLNALNEEKARKLKPGDRLRIR